MPFLLDTGVLTAYLQGRLKMTALVRPWVSQDESVTSILIYGEIIEYFKRLSDFQRHQMYLRKALRTIHPYQLTYAIEERYADLRRALRPPYGPGIIGDVDTLIAATALEHHCTLVTADSDYQRVSGLTLLMVERADLK